MWNLHEMDALSFCFKKKKEKESVFPWFLLFVSGFRSFRWVILSCSMASQSHDQNERMLKKNPRIRDRRRTPFK